MDENPLWDLRGRGQGIWLRGLRRLLAEADSLAELVASYGISGIETDLLLLAGAGARGPGAWRMFAFRASPDGKRKERAGTCGYSGSIRGFGAWAGA